jgi:hypothetical protein
LERHRRGVDLTPAGHALLRDARLALLHIARATEAAMLTGARGGPRDPDGLDPSASGLGRAARPLADAAATPRRRLTGPERLAMIDPPVAEGQLLT